MFTGSLVPIVTPFSDGKVDRDGLERVIEFALENGSNGIVPCGTTGESATLTHQEHEDVVAWTIEIVRRRVPVIAGTGSNATAEAIRLTQSAKDAGADGALLISPYYNKPTQEGIYQHYKVIAAAVQPMPILIYNIPGRTGSKIEPATLGRLAAIDNIAGVKEATGSMDNVIDTIAAASPDLAVYSGEDSLGFLTLAAGGRGIIAASANVLPREMANLVRLCEEGQWDKARQISYDILPLVRLLFSEVNPIPVKTACAMMGLCTDEMRLPLTPMSENNRKILEAELRARGLLK
jgi:4-hydroxy-tetrahydrodipicolinate synthase